MDISARNKKIAVKRWKVTHAREKLRILKNKTGRLLKASICGFLAGDGSLSVRREGNSTNCEMRFYPDDKRMLQKFLDAIQTYYGKKATVFYRKNFFAARLTSKTVVQDLLKTASFGIHTWNVPWNLLSGQEHKKAWLAAFFSAEAYVGPKVIKIQTVNDKGMRDVAKLLTKFDIRHSIYYYTPKKQNHSRVTIIMIHRKTARKQYYEKIGFVHEEKTRLLKESLGL